MTFKSIPSHYFEKVKRKKSKGSIQKSFLKNGIVRTINWGKPENPTPSNNNLTQTEQDHNTTSTQLYLFESHKIKTSSKALQAKREALQAEREVHSLFLAPSYPHTTHKPPITHLPFCFLKHHNIWGLIRRKIFNNPFFSKISILEYSS